MPQREPSPPVRAATDVKRPKGHACADFVDRYRRNRARSHELFAMLADEAYYSQPIALRHPVVFYEGHLPGFSFNTLVKKALGGPSIDARLESLFARGIDPPESAAALSHPPSAQDQWPSREAVRAFAAEADRLVIDALQHADIERPGHPLLDRSEAVFAILEHEEMHQETLRYMWHRLPFPQKTAPAGYHPRTEGAPAPGSGFTFPRVAQRWASIARRFRSAGTTNVRRGRSMCRASRSSATM